MTVAEFLKLNLSLKEMTLIVSENKFVKWPRISSDNKFGEEKSV